jgi:glycosyltransferase involved in cell wall biosynthesis
MEKNPFSVLMSVYHKDDPDHFAIAVDSILNQTVRPNEVVLVVDGTVPDKLRNVIVQYQQEGIGYQKVKDMA